MYLGVMIGYGVFNSRISAAASAYANLDDQVFQNDHISACRDELLAALAELEAQPAAPAAVKDSDWDADFGAPAGVCCAYLPPILCPVMLLPL